MTGLRKESILKMKLKKRLIILAVFVFFILADTALLSTGQSILELYPQFQRINKVSPTVQVSFQEEIEVKNATWYGISDAVMEKNAPLFEQFLETGDIIYLLSIQGAVVPISTEVYSNSVSVAPVNPLFNGYHILELKVVDLIGNPATHLSYFYLNVTETQITIIEPRLGVSNQQANNITIRTTRNGIPEPTECKIGIDNPLYNFDALSLKPFDSSSEDKVQHTATDVFSKFGLGTSGQFYILCKDTVLGRVNQKRFDVYIDTVPPSIRSFTFTPKKVVEYPEAGNQLTALLNVTTNEPVICRYSFQNDADYADMTPFDNFNIFNFDAYNIFNAQSHALPPETKASYKFYVQCEDRAGWRTGKAQAKLEVDLSAGLGINVVYPPQYTRNKSIELIATTNKRASCQISGEKITSPTAMQSMIDQKTHRYNLGLLNDGTFTYTISCRSTAAGILQDQSLNYRFVIDNTKPVGLPEINGTLLTCYNDRFVFEPPLELAAVDAESGISHFMVEIKEGSVFLLNSTRVENLLSTIDEDNEGESFELKNDTTYSFIIKAVNNVDLEGSPRTVSVKYDPLNDICFEKNPPTVIITENKSPSVTAVTFECIDDSGCDENSFYYGTGDSIENCTADTKLSGPPFIADIRETEYVCYFVSDIVGNNATGVQMIEVEAADYCTDLKKDGDESDVDCGGSCPGCEINQSCIEDIDCKSNYCEMDVCTRTACDDGVLNGPLNNMESDVDCGGYCSGLGFACELGKSCSKNDDCDSGLCNKGEGICVESTCDDSLKGPEESDVDCGGICAMEELKLCDIGSSCDLNEDCISGNCIAGKCKEKVTLVVEKESNIGAIFMILGILMIVGGAGYLVYKKEVLAPSAQKAGARGAGAPGGPSREELEKLRAKRLAEEQRRRAIEEQRRRMIEEARKREEMASKRRGELEKKRLQEREKLFGKFGERRELPSGKPSLEEEIAGKEREGWLSLGALKNLIMPKKEKKEETRGIEAPPAPKPSTAFDQLGKIEEQEDIYKRLEEVGSKKGEGAFDELEKIASKEGTSAYDALRKHINKGRKRRTRANSRRR